MFRSQLVGGCLALGLAAACSPSGADPQSAAAPAGLGGAPPSAVRAAWPAPLFDPELGGSAPALQLVSLRWGRLVDVYALDPATGERALAYADLVIGASIASDGVDYELRSVRGSGEVQLTVLHPPGSAAFDQALAQLDATLTPVADLSAPPFSVVPRNAALELRFQDLLDPATIGPESVRLAVGLPPETPFEARVLADPNHGGLADPDGDGLFELFPTRVIVDLAVSELEALESDPPVAENALGLPAATSAAVANARLRLPTRTAPSVGQTLVLRNLAGNALSFTANGSNDPASPTADIVRAFRSGGASEALGDPVEGFLPDDEAPALVGTLQVAVSGAPVADPLRPGVFTFPSMSFGDPSCAPSPEPGDRLQIGSVWTVLEGYAQQAGALVAKPRVRVVHPGGATPQPGAAALTTPFDADAARCFLAFEPPAGAPPDEGVSPAASVLVAFSEPMSASSLAPYAGLSLSRVPLDPDAFELVVGAVDSGADARAFRFVPALPLDHAQGASEAYHVLLGAGAEAPTDLAGNPLADDPGALSFRLDPAAVSVATGGLVLRFGSTDELYDDGLAELRGQQVYDLTAGELLPRPLARFSVAADVEQPVPSAMTSFAPGARTPLVPLGCKLQTLWRYCDLGFAAADESRTNLDVEGLAWAPLDGQVVAEVWDEFSIALGHSARLPDEFLNPRNPLLPEYPASGLRRTYADNYLPSEPEGGTVVHPRERGYAIDPSELFVSGSGRPLMPWPLNREVPVEQRRYYTWRDTALLETGGEDGAGVPLAQEVSVLGLPPGEVGSLYEPGAVRSIGLPLLFEYRCYPGSSAMGLNGFTTLLASDVFPQLGLRVFSAGGVNVNNQAVVKDPDLESIASGGFDPESAPPGLPTAPQDSSFFVGQVDFVTRVSRAHSVWFPAGTGPASFAPERLVAQLPEGTEVQAHWRGATALVLSPGGSDLSTDASLLDPYGDPLPGVVDQPVFLDGDASWKDELAELDGASWVQLRLTFVGNAVSMQTAALDALGVAWSN